MRQTNINHEGGQSKLKQLFLTDIKKINTYLLLIVGIIILTSIGYTSYALFSYETYAPGSIHVVFSGIEGPILSVTNPPSNDDTNPTITTNGTYTVNGTVSDKYSKVKSVTVNGTAVTVSSDGSWQSDLTLESDITTEITIIATDILDNTTTEKRYVVYNSAAPTLTVSAPTGTTSSSPTSTNSASYTVTGTVSDANGIKSLTVNGTAVTVSNGSFSQSITLTANTVTTVTVVATDNYGRTTTVTRYVIYNSGPFYLFKTGQGFVEGQVISYTDFSTQSNNHTWVVIDNSEYVHLNFNNTNNYETGRYGSGASVIIGLKGGGKVDFSKYKTLYFEFENPGYKGSSSYTRAAYGYTTLNSEASVYCSGANPIGFTNSVFDLTTSKTTKSIDISSVTDQYYIAVAQSSAVNYETGMFGYVVRGGVYIYNIWLE